MTTVKNTITKTKDAPDDRDVIIGKRVRAYREIQGFTQTELGEKLGITFQQIQKYESGRNKVSVSRLIDLCKVLDTSMEHLLSGLEKPETASPHIIAVSDVAQDRIISDPERNKEIAELLKIYNSVESVEDRREILNVLKALTDAKRKRSA